MENIWLELNDLQPNSSNSVMNNFSAIYASKRPIRPVSSTLPFDVIVDVINEKRNAQWQLDGRTFLRGSNFYYS